MNDQSKSLGRERGALQCLQWVMKDNIAKEWLSYGLEKGDDFFTKFMMYWIAFNRLYSENSYNEKSERKQIRLFCKDKLQELKRYDAFSKSEFQVLAEKPVMDARTTTIDNYTEQQYERMKRGSIIDLLLTIYQMRCNLFHGSKSLMNPRDIALVRASAGGI